MVQLRAACGDGPLRHVVPSHPTKREGRSWWHVQARLDARLISASSKRRPGQITKQQGGIESPLQQLLGHERREQHDLQAHQGRDLGLLGKHDFALIVERQPFETPAVGAEAQAVRALKLADVDDADDFLTSGTFRNGQPSAVAGLVSTKDELRDESRSRV